MGRIKSFFDKIVSKSKRVLKRIMDAVPKKSKKKSGYDALSTTIGSSIKDVPNKKERTYTPDQFEKTEDEVVQANFASRTEKWSYSIDKALRQNDGLIFVKD